MAGPSTFDQHDAPNGARRKSIPANEYPAPSPEVSFSHLDANTPAAIGPTTHKEHDSNSTGSEQDRAYGNIATNTRRRSTIKTISTVLTKTITGVRTPKAPWQHAPHEKGEEAGDATSSTVRVFDHRRQRRRLIFSAGLRWLGTAILCGGMAGCLAGFHHIVSLSTAQKHAFNALVTFFSMAIGFSLASSMRLYAQMLRWRFLASGYRTLQQFADIMKCEDQLNCVKLLWTGRNKGRWLPSLTQVLALLSILINLFLQVITALVGLTYQVEVSDSFVVDKVGKVSIVDLSSIEAALGYKDDAFDYQCTGAYGYGMAGASSLFETSNNTSYQDDEWSSYYCSTDQSTCWYWFSDQSIDGSLSETSSRKVYSTATCQNLTVLQGGYAGVEDIDSQSPNVQYKDEDGNTKWLDVPTDITLQKSTTFIGNTTEPPCGSRCSELFVLVSADNDTIPNPLLFKCQNAVSNVTNIYLNSRFHDAGQYELSDDTARALAGAIGFTGFRALSAGFPALEYVLYPDGTRWSPEGTYSNGVKMENTEAAAAQTAALIMQFSIGALVALDSVGPRINVTDYGPTPDLVVDVDWLWAILILAGIPATQMVALVCVIIWANKAIIKDDSCLSTARLLRPVVDRLGDHGCLLTGDEIAKELENVKVIYGVRGPDELDNESAIKHLDVIQENEKLPTNQRMPAGVAAGL
ncbi:hypothetical protein H2200_012321 [Cladophialophora chaetospira]|uniref:Uncharacterized protein n=1 Tax=Cladophialophora chaetospira TaxID=386627 RepID=A0AA38WXK9_9EURO|nr:hypothetical protein H2200_012321 [Cladophialophora chaetospira]